MATIKSYTDIEQSKKLAKILPLESADMHYSKDCDGSWFVDLAKYTSVKIPKYVGNIEEHLLPCWSLAALLNILPYKISLSHDMIDANGNPAYKNERYKFFINRCGLFGDKWNTQYCGKHQRQLGKRYKELYIDLFLSKNYDNPVDVCYEMILKLNEFKRL